MRIFRLKSWNNWFNRVLPRIIGIDPGSRITGFAIIDTDGQKSHHVVSGCIKTQGADFPQRLGIIFKDVSELIKTYNPVEMSIEQVFMATNAGAALKLGQARGAAICAAVEHDLSVAEYAPRLIKQAVVGRGGADKAQVQQMVKIILNLHIPMTPDQSDAIAIALCHAHSRFLLNKMSQTT